jgi:FixJ family two-component response regulator
MQEEKRLSDRQTSVVRLVAEGRTNKEIERILNITLKTGGNPSSSRHAEAPPVVSRRSRALRRSQWFDRALMQ